MKQSVKFKVLVGFVLAAMLALFMVACSSGSGSASSTSDSASSESVSASSESASAASESASAASDSASASAAAGGFEVVDVTGKVFTLEAPVNKVIGTHNPTLNAVVVIGGGGQHLAGFGNKEKADGLYSKVIEGWDGLTSIGKGKEVNFETVATLGADMALVPERQASMAEEYAKVGLDTFVALPNEESFDTIKESLTRIGTLFGKSDRAAEINAEFDKLVSEASAACEGAAEKPSVLFMGDDLYEVASSSMIQTYIIDAVGATNAVQGDYKPGEFASVDAETIAGFNPDVIWIPNYASYSVDDVLNDPKLAEVSAVKNGAVYMFPSKLEPWDYPTASTCLGVCWAANSLHPDQYSKEDLMKAADEFYTLVYGKTFTAEELGI
ncbi:MAG: ABC transporter substrate-binding protein [Eggerthellaceae bacterium]|nr:ABC transporter substrate-binding protein [Eggerthellaceae bacterium]